MAVMLAGNCWAAANASDQMQIAQATATASGVPQNVGRTGVTDNQILIGSCVPIGSTLKERAHEVTLGANLYFSYVNDKGGVNGRKIKLDVCDDRYDPEKAIECFNSCLKDKVFAGAFFIGSAPITKYVRMAELHNMPMVGFCTGVPVVYQYHRTQFVLRPGYEDEIKHQIEELWDKQHVRRIAVIYQSDAFGAAIREGVRKNLAKFGAAPVAEASFARTETDIDDTLSEVSGGKPEVVIVGATSKALKGLIEKKLHQDSKVVFVTFSVATDYLLQMGKTADGTVVTEVLPELDDKLPTVQLYKTLLKKYAPNERPNPSALEGVLNAMVIVEGLKRAGRDLTRDGFVKALESLHEFDLGVGPQYMVNFSAGNHSGLTDKAVYFLIVRDGKLVPITAADWKQVLKR